MFRKPWYILVELTLFTGLPVSAQNTARCDTLIKHGVEAMWDKQHAKSLELLTEARAMAEKNHWYNQQFLALNNIGANYYNMLDYGEALNYYLESYTLAVKKLKPTNEMVVLNNIAILYSTEKNYLKAKEYLNKAYTIAKENKDSIKTGLYAMNLGQVENEAKNYREARRYIEISLPLLKKEPNLYSLGLTTRIENDLYLGKAEKARNDARALLKEIKNPGFNDIGLLLRVVIARSYMETKQTADAIVAINEIIGMKPGLKMRQEMYSLMADAYAEEENYTKSLAFKDSVLNTEKELNRIKNGELYQTNRVKFELQDYQNQLAINKQKLRSEQKFIYYLLAVGVALIIIIVLVARNITVKNRQRQLLAEANEKDMALQLEQEKNERLLLGQQILEKEAASLLEQERLKSEIESRNRKLSARALYLSERNTLIEELVESLGKNPALSGNPALMQHVRSLKVHLKGTDDWDSFLSHFEEVNNRLLEKLKTKHPSLTANDLRFIAYIYMNLSTKEIATLLNITPEACRKRRERLGAKMELPATTSLYDYLAVV
jgi:hypothetical protein